MKPTAFERAVKKAKTPKGKKQLQKKLETLNDQTSA